MSLRRIAPGIVIDEGPGRARVAGYGGSAIGHALTLSTARPNTRKPDKLRGEALEEHRRKMRRGRRHP